MSRIAQRPGHPVGCPGPSCSCGALLLTSRFLALPLAFLSLVLPDLLALLAVFRVSLPILLQILRHPLALQFLESGFPLSLVGSPVQAISSFRSGLRARPRSCTRQGLQCKTILTDSS